MTHAFAASPDALWRALAMALPAVTDKAAFYEQARRVEWSVDATGRSWTQELRAAVEPTASGTSVLRFSGRSRVRYSFGDRRRRRDMFERLVAAITDALEHPLTWADEPHTGDEYRWWDGTKWTFEPPSP